MAWAKFAVTATLAAISSAFNIDTNHPILASPSSNYENSFFGYSIVIKDSSLYVGAPGHEGTGGVFRCDFDGSTVDKQVIHALGTTRELIPFLPACRMNSIALDQKFGVHNQSWSAVFHPSKSAVGDLVQQDSRKCHPYPVWYPSTLLHRRLCGNDG